MSGWVPMPADGWPETAELLTSTGKAWPEQAVIADLRWHVDQGKAIPGRPTLCRRWAWDDWPVRRLLADEARWRDPLRAHVPPAGTRIHQPSPESTSRVNGERQQSEPNHQLPPASTSFHQDPSTGAVYSPSPPPTPPPAGDAANGLDYVVRGAKAGGPDPNVVAELLHLERDEGRELLNHSSASRDALNTALRNGHTPDWLRDLLGKAERAGIRKLRWSVLLGPKLADLRAELDAELRARERQRSQYRTQPYVETAIAQPPPRQPP